MVAGYSLFSKLKIAGGKLTIKNSKTEQRGIMLNGYLWRRNFRKYFELFWFYSVSIRSSTTFNRRFPYDCIEILTMRFEKHNSPQVNNSLLWYHLTIYSEKPLLNATRIRSRQSLHLIQWVAYFVISTLPIELEACVIRYYRGLIKLHSCLGTCIVFAQAVSCTGHIPFLLALVFAPFDKTSAKAFEKTYTPMFLLYRK